MASVHLTFTDEPTDIGWIPQHAEALPRDFRDELRRLLCDFAEARGELETESYLPRLPEGTYALMIPRTRFHVRLGRPDKNEVDNLLRLAAAIFVASGGNIRLSSAATLNALRDRLSALRVEYGERSIIDAVLALGSPTAGNVSAYLARRRCPYPTSGCRFLEGSECNVSEPQVEAVMEDLVGRKVLKHKNNFPPLEYAIKI